MKIRTQLNILILGIILIPLVSIIALPLYHYATSSERRLLNGYKQIREMGEYDLSEDDWEMIRLEINNIPPTVQVAIYYDYSVLILKFLYGYAWSGNASRYPLEIETGSGFGLNDMVAFHGIRAGNLIANNHIMHLQFDYTIPIIIISRNPLSIPLAFNRIGLGLLGDWALKSNTDYVPDIKNSMFGLGAELYIDLTLGYNYPMRIGLGYEEGLAKAGEESYYIWMTF